MPISEDNQAIVDAIDRKIGNTNGIYAGLATIVAFMLIQSLVIYFSISGTNKILSEFVEQVKLNTNNRAETPVILHSLDSLTNTLNKFMFESDRAALERERKLNAFIDLQNAFNQKHTVLLDDAKTYINQNPIELLRKGMVK